MVDGVLVDTNAMPFDHIDFAGGDNRDGSGSSDDADSPPPARPSRDRVNAMRVRVENRRDRSIVCRFERLRGAHDERRLR